MKVYINDEARDIREECTIAELVEAMEFPRRGSAVEVNRNVILRSNHDNHVLREGDRVEIVTLVGGG